MPMATRPPRNKPVDTPAAQQQPTPPDPVCLVPIEAPFVPTSKYAQREIHMRLDTLQAETLRALFEGLELTRATTSTGPVQSQQDALRWMLEELRRRSPLSPHATT